jgi:hypothetical protein
MVSEYLKNELPMFRWTQLPLTELKGLEEMLEIKIGNGHLGWTEQILKWLSSTLTPILHFTSK